jgi:hypothetical protein
MVHSTFTILYVLSVFLALTAFVPHPHSARSRRPKPCQELPPL